MQLSVTPLQWPSGSISNIPNDGLWDNHGRMTIHIPFFEDSFCEDYKNVEFFHAYDDDIYVCRSRVLYVDLNDIVFSNTVWSGMQKVRVFFKKKNSMIHANNCISYFIYIHNRIYPSPNLTPLVQRVHASVNV